ncbi:MAG: flagellar hook-basal body protein [Calditrichia bacterium]
MPKDMRMNMELAKLKASLIGQVRKNEIVANNLANINTTGFKKDRLFLELLEGDETAGEKVNFRTDFRTGQLQTTDNPLDVAIAGEGYLVVEEDSGETALTRNGHLRISADGRLETADGKPVLGENGWIQVTSPDAILADFTITQSGEIYANEQFLDRLQLVNYENPESLIKLGGNLFQATDESVPMLIGDSQVQQGFLENSNVNPVEEMVQLVELQRQFESVQRMVRSLDDTFKLAANQVGKV